MGKLRKRLQEQFSSSDLVKGLPFAKEGLRRWHAWEKLNQADLNARLRTLGAARRKLEDQQAEQKVKESSLTPAEEKQLQDEEDTEQQRTRHDPPLYPCG